MNVECGILGWPFSGLLSTTGLTERGDEETLKRYFEMSPMR